jgi:hypothetical protein
LLLLLVWVGLWQVPVALVEHHHLELMPQQLAVLVGPLWVAAVLAELDHLVT